MNNAERDTILAALRCWQRNSPNVENTDSRLWALATQAGAHDALTSDEIDGLCERLNIDLDRPPPAIQRARIQVEHWDQHGAPEPENRHERLATLIDILQAIAGPADQDECEHMPDWNTVNSLDGEQGVVDINCSGCGLSGSFRIDNEDVNW